MTWKAEGKCVLEFGHLLCGACQDRCFPGFEDIAAGHRFSDQTSFANFALFAPLR